MQGQGTVSATDKEGKEKPGTLNSLLKDPEKAPLLQDLVDKQGNWSEKSDDVWVYDVNEFGNRHGILEFGYGWDLGSRKWFGPELKFGHVMEEHLNQPILIIKTAWGGKNLYQDFRPPSSGGTIGPSYTEMIATVKNVLKNLQRLYPDYDGRDYQLAGFVWWQGWNDYCSTQGPSEYELNMVNLIKDVRHDLNAPKLPVVVGELAGPWGGDSQDVAAEEIRTAQKNAASRPEFAGNVKFAETHDFVRTEAESPSDEGYHEFKNGETYLRIGDAFALGMLQLMGKP
jgi:alpha-galactosidase